MKQIIIFSVVSILATSCLTTNRMSSFVDTKTKRLEHKELLSKNWLIVKSDKNEPKKNICKKKKSYFIPAILYWGWNSTFECELNANTKTNIIKEGIYKAADSLNLKEYLQEDTLEITLKEMPGKFLYVNKGDVIIFIIAYTYILVETISPYLINLEFEYIINNNGKIKMNGKGIIQNKEQPLRNIWRSSKKFIWLYLDEYQNEIDRMGVKLVSKIIDDIKNKNR